MRWQAKNRYSNCNVRIHELSLRHFQFAEDISMTLLFQSKDTESI